LLDVKIYLKRGTSIAPARIKKQIYNIWIIAFADGSPLRVWPANNSSQYEKGKTLLKTLAISGIPNEGNVRPAKVTASMVYALARDKASLMFFMIAVKKIAIN